MKLTDAQYQKLASIPDEWALVPVSGDTRPIPPLYRLGLIEERKTDVTPEEWGGIASVVRMVRHEWRRTDAGRLALKNQESDRG